MNPTPYEYLVSYHFEHEGKNGYGCMSLSRNLPINSHASTKSVTDFIVSENGWEGGKVVILNIVRLSKPMNTKNKVGFVMMSGAFAYAVALLGGASVAGFIAILMFGIGAGLAAIDN